MGYACVMQVFPYCDKFLKCVLGCVVLSREQCRWSYFEIFLMSSETRKKFIHHFITDFICKIVKDIVDLFSHWSTNQVMLKMSWPVVEVADEDKEMLTGVVEGDWSWGKRSTSEKSNSTRAALCAVLWGVRFQNRTAFSTGLVVVALVPANRKSCQQNPLSQRMWEIYPSTLFKET